MGNHIIKSLRIDKEKKTVTMDSYWSSCLPSTSEKKIEPVLTKVFKKKGMIALEIAIVVFILKRYIYRNSLWYKIGNLYYYQLCSPLMISALEEEMEFSHVKEIPDLQFEMSSRLLTLGRKLQKMKGNFVLIKHEAGEPNCYYVSGKPRSDKFKVTNDIEKSKKYKNMLSAIASHRTSINIPGMSWDVYDLDNKKTLFSFSAYDNCVENIVS